eukprot:CAMPEP_0115858478 /NCGR_PEP_ID=MMETSP0287-20121206/16120_1 /TAXON_ID=412157 /ORGANISM="Chrysochromulina rotalis, Strain UIO044" /LENGTH=286 /DNA_ID=CAMNT_0003312747 /DNA_START=1 /DNA_END=862 /DNA_ORIENTATION=+
MVLGVAPGADAVRVFAARVRGTHKFEGCVNHLAHTVRSFLHQLPHAAYGARCSSRSQMRCACSLLASAARTSLRVASTTSRTRSEAFSTSFRTPHMVLGVAPGASSEEVKKAYRQKALEYHPDKHSATTRDDAEREFKAVSEAYEQLTGTTGSLSRRLTVEDAEALFHEVFGADRNAELAWRVPGRHRPLLHPPSWQQYQIALESGDDERFTSGQEARALYRSCLRALSRVDQAVADGVREHARALLEANAQESDVIRIRALLTDGRHSLDEMSKCLDTAVVREDS